uniref:Uncharacterized protein n=1 Tax=Vespula pensylvanica TaxID=30213 RepID=A0A834P944_VESPE|nr:hypothetical protein H0235_002160 [Vespula pensylvanica]
MQPDSVVKEDKQISSERASEQYGKPRDLDDLTGRRSECVGSEWMYGWIGGWMDGWLAGWLVGWLVGWLLESDHSRCGLRRIDDGATSIGDERYCRF